MNNIKTPIVHLTILLIFVASCGWLFYLTEQKIKSGNLLQAQLNIFISNSSKLDNLADTLPALKIEASQWLKSLPTNETDVAIFASKLEQFAKIQGLTILIHFDDFPKLMDVSGTKIYGLSADISLDGTYQGTTRFLELLTKSREFFKIDKMTMTKKETKPGIGTLLNGVLMMNLENI